MKQDLNRLEQWAELWQMKFNVDKCKVMHVGIHNKRQKYKMGGKELAEIKEEKDLGVYVDNTFKVANQCSKSAKKGNQILGMINRTFSCKSRKVIVSLYKALVRPHLDYCGQAWRPYLAKDKDILEKVQRRATRMMEGCSKLNYMIRLKKANLTTLETRRERADMLEVYKILNGLEGVQEDNFFTRNSRIGRGHSFKLYKRRTRINIAKFSFGNRTCDPWNQLPETVVSAPNVNVFKNRLDNYLRNIRGFK